MANRLLIRALFASNPDKPDESLAVLDVLLGAGADPAQPDGDGSSSLHVAASKLTLEPEFASIAFEALLQRLPQEPDLLRDAEGATPLAAVVGRVRASGGMVAPEGEAAVVQSAQLLIDRGSSILGRSDAAAAASLSASYNAGADAGGEAGSAPAATLLHEAAEWAPLELLEALLLADDVESGMATADAYGDGPLQIALAKGRRDIAAAILAAFPLACEGPWAPGGGRLPANRRTLDYALHRLIAGAVRSPPQAASLRKTSDPAACARLLIEHYGAPLDAKDERGRTPLAAALVTNVSEQLTALLLRHDTLPEEADDEGRCPLMHSAANGDAVAVGLLLDRIRAAAADGGALGEGESRVLAVDRTGRSALMLAAASRSAESVKLLLDAGSDVQIVDEDGRCALLIALVGASASASGSDAQLPAILGALAAPPTAACVSLIRRAEATEAIAAELAASKVQLPEPPPPAEPSEPPSTEPPAEEPPPPLPPAEEAPTGLAAELEGLMAKSGAPAPAAAAPSPPPPLPEPTLPEPLFPAPMATDEQAASAGRVAAALMAAVCSVHGQCALSAAAALDSPAAFDALSSALDAAGVGLTLSGCVPLIAASASGHVTSVSRLLAKDTRKTLLQPPTRSLRALGSRVPIGVLEASAASSRLRRPRCCQPWARRGAAHFALARQIHRRRGACGAREPAIEADGRWRACGWVDALAAAAAAGAIECVQLLLGPGSSSTGLVTAVDGEGLTALMHAAAGRSQACVAALLSAGSDANATDSAGRTPLSHAAAGGDIGCVEAVYAAAPATLHSVSASGATPLLESAASAISRSGEIDATHLELLDLLVSYGAPLDTTLDALCAAHRRVPPANASASTLTWEAPKRLAAVLSLAKAAGGGMLTWRALRLCAPPDLLGLLLAALARAGTLNNEAAHRASGRGLLHTAVLLVSDGRLRDEHAITLARGLPEGELLRGDADGLTAIGLATERGLEALGLGLETAVLKRLHVLVEIVCAVQHLPHASRMAEKPQLLAAARSARPPAPGDEGVGAAHLVV